MSSSPGRKTAVASQSRLEHVGGLNGRNGWPAVAPDENLELMTLPSIPFRNFIGPGIGQWLAVRVGQAGPEGQEHRLDAVA